MPDKKEFKNCPNCGGEIYAKAIKCKHCKVFIDKEPVQVQPEIGFFQSLFDLSMKKMIAPKIIRVIYIVGLVVYTLSALAVLIYSFTTSQAGLIILAIIYVPLGFVIIVTLLRVYLEIIITLFGIYDELKIISNK